MHNMRVLIEDCCGWNRKTWADAVEFALSRVPGKLEGMKVLEIGASKHSSLSPIFARKGADVICSYFNEEEVEEGQLRIVIEKHRLNQIPVVELDIACIQGVYDLIVMKSVLGNMCREHEATNFQSIIDKLFRENIDENGWLITLDNGHLPLFEFLRRRWGAGRSERPWVYFKPDEIESSISAYDFDIRGFGFLNLGAASRKAGYVAGANFDRLEFVNHLMYFLDRIVQFVFRPKNAVVLATVLRRRCTASNVERILPLDDCQQRDGGELGDPDRERVAPAGDRL
jgi:hypothetical protein